MYVCDSASERGRACVHGREGVEQRRSWSETKLAHRLYMVWFFVQKYVDILNYLFRETLSFGDASPSSGTSYQMIKSCRRQLGHTVLSPTQIIRSHEELSQLSEVSPRDSQQSLEEQRKHSPSGVPTRNKIHFRSGDWEITWMVLHLQSTFMDKSHSTAAKHLTHCVLEPWLAARGTASACTCRTVCIKLWYF